jgi:hypothetical protein
MTDSTKWKSVMLRVNDYELLKELADFRKQKIATVLADSIHSQWDKTFPPIKPVTETSHARPKNPFLIPEY